MYDLTDYGQMIADSVRMDPYIYALKDAIGPDTVVLDIGAATGIHALLAAKFGARKVYAIEPNEAIHLAIELAEANGYASQIEFIQALSTDIALPEKADVIISDLRGTLPLYENHIRTIVDARRRHLAANGQLIPLRDTLWVAVVEKKRLYHDYVGPWDYPYGLNMEIAKRMALNSWNGDNSGEIRLRDLLTEPRKWAILDYMTIKNPNVSQTISRQKVARNGIAHGLLVWFDAEIGPGQGFSNGPQDNRIADVYGRAFFPLLEPVVVTEGDLISITVSAILNKGDYDWSWETHILDHHTERKKAYFRQSTAAVDPNNG